jgi:BirA family biotin operon repressor/biotin-[acetyl-CoA-carboxylase] ligase
MNESVFTNRIMNFSSTYHGPFVKKIYAFDDLPSTNITVRSLAVQGAEEGTIVIAQTQRKGRGRFNRVWQSPKGGAYLSLLLRPKAPAEKTSLLTYVAALAVTHTIRSFNLPARIKWPNDVLVHGKKIAGILLESEATNTQVSYVIVGIGVNLNTNLAHLSTDVRKNATSLRKEHGSPIDYDEFLTTFFHQFDRFYQLFSAGHFDQIIEEWKNQSDTLGKRIRVQTTNTIIQGTAVDVDRTGFLLLKTSKGTILRVTSGDCTVIDES